MPTEDEISEAVKNLQRNRSGGGVAYPRITPKKVARGGQNRGDGGRERRGEDRGGGGRRIAVGKSGLD